MAWFGSELAFVSEATIARPEYEDDTNRSSDKSNGQPLGKQVRHRDGSPVRFGTAVANDLPEPFLT
jgi:hypothetical protein